MGPQMKRESSSLGSVEGNLAQREALTVTQPYLPPLEDFLPYLEKMWSSKVLTNCGPFHRQFENELAEYLGVPYVSLFSNATIALVTALQALRIVGEVITTPYSFVATAHSLLWNGIKPVFVDIDSNTLNIDPGKIEAAITPQTSAIMPVHCYGLPCDIDAIQEIANNYNLKVIYDAAHAFGVRRNDMGSILNAGDLSVLSFHATKVFNTFEGGAIVSRDAKTKQHIDHLKNFGFVDETTVVAAGINGKMSEFNAALGLVQLKHVDYAIKRRSDLNKLYHQMLAGVPGVRLLSIPADVTHNHAYFPIFLDREFPVSRDMVYQSLKEAGINGRRYFFPLITEFPMYRGLPSARLTQLPTAYQASRQVICLPLYPAMTNDEVQHICKHILALAVDPIRQTKRTTKLTLSPAGSGIPAEKFHPAHALMSISV